jgi:hypothetical protein
MTTYNRAVSQTECTSVDSIEEDRTNKHTVLHTGNRQRFGTRRTGSFCAGRISRVINPTLAKSGFNFAPVCFFIR